MEDRSGGFYVRATFPNGAPEQIQGFATEAAAARWIKNESALWLHQRRALAEQSVVG
jgi:hypothetical protein